MQLDISVLPSILHWVMLLLFGLVAGKGLLIVTLVRLGGYETGVAMRTGIVLAQGGEFGFALLALALGNDVLTHEQTQPVLAAILLSMVIAPLLIRRNGPLAKWISRSYREHRVAETNQIADEASHLTGHVLICGFGRIGQNLALFLDEKRIDYLALDMDPTLISEAWEAGQRVFYTNAANPQVLQVSGIDKASALVVAFDDFRTAEQILHSVRRPNPDIPVIVRAHTDAHLEALEEAGATEVVPESVEASLILATRLLNQLGIAIDEIQSMIEQARTDHYNRVRRYFHGHDEIVEFDQTEDHFHLHTVVLTPGDRAIGQRIENLRLDELSVSVVSVRRAGICGEEPDPKMTLRGGAVVRFDPAGQC